MDQTVPKFELGQLVHHKKFNYRGVIVQVDETFQGTDDWYDEVALTRPPRNKPWYRVLVNKAEHETYVAERHLEADLSNRPIDHPCLPLYFDEFQGTHYVRTRLVN